MGNDSSNIEAIVEDAKNSIKSQLKRRSYLASLELYNSSQIILRGKRIGRTYRVPNTAQYYTASAPGEPPATRTGVFRMSWQPVSYMDGDTFHSEIQNKTKVHGKSYLLGEILENGRRHMAPRPYRQKIQEHARWKIMKIYERPYHS